MDWQLPGNNKRGPMQPLQISKDFIGINRPDELSDEDLSVVSPKKRKRTSDESDHWSKLMPPPPHNPTHQTSSNSSPTLNIRTMALQTARYTGPPRLPRSSSQTLANSSPPPRNLKNMITTPERSAHLRRLDDSRELAKSNMEDESIKTAQVAKEIQEASKRLRIRLEEQSEDRQNHKQMDNTSPSDQTLANSKTVPAARPRQTARCSPRPSREADHNTNPVSTHAEIIPSARPRQTARYRPGKDVDSNFEPKPASRQEVTTPVLRKRPSLSRSSDGSRPHYTDGEEEYLKAMEDEPLSSPESSPSKSVTGPLMTTIEDPTPEPAPEPPRKFVIGIDFGTTFSSVSYIALPDEPTTTRIFPHEIRTIREWPDDNLNAASMQVPTEVWYSANPIERDPRNGHLELTDSESDPEDDDSDIVPQLVDVTRKKKAPTCFPKLSGSVPPLSSCRDDNKSEKLLWGYECPYQRYIAHSTRSQQRHITRPKLMLLDSDHTNDDRVRLGPQLQHLIENNIIRKHGTEDSLPGYRDVQDVITDFFVPVLLHTRRQLIKEERYTDNCPVLFALTVPTIWSSKASRVLQHALEEAIRITGFGTLTDRSVENLCVITEPKAAAAYLLGLGHANDLRAGSTFVVMDCGGGTVDGSTYSVAPGASLRLGDEICYPGGAACGASYLNENYRELLKERLQDEKYLEINGNTIDSFIDDTMPFFESHEKRNKDINAKPSSRVKIPNLRKHRLRKLAANKPDKYEDNFLLLWPDDFKKIFLPLLDRTAEVLDNQLKAAIALGKKPKKVFLIGGFGASVSMRSYLKEHLRNFAQKQQLDYTIELILPSVQECITAVSAGAVMQALSPDRNTDRKFVSSLGIRRLHHYDPSASAHKGADIFFEACTKEKYVPVIEYFVLKGDTMNSKRTFEPFEMVHYFDSDQTEFVCEEEVYVSDKRTKTDYPVEHHHNRDAAIEGRIKTDFTFLFKQNKLKVIPRSKEKGVWMEEHYVIAYELVPYIEGNNLKYRAWYPSAKEGKMLKEAQICITSVFKPDS